MCLGEVARKISKFLMKLLNKTKSFLFFLITRQFERFGAKRTGKDAKYHMNRLQDFMNCWGLVRAVKMSCNKVTKVFIILACSFSLPSSSSCTSLVCPNHQLCLGDPDSEGVLGTVSFSSSGLKWWCLKPQIGTHILVSSAVNEEEMEVPRNGIYKKKGGKEGIPLPACRKWCGNSSVWFSLSAWDKYEWVWHVLLASVYSLFN